MNDALIRLLGWRATILHGDPCVVDRWVFAQRHLRRGGARTLDAGAGNGGFAMGAADRGNTAVGLSWDDEEVRTAERRARRCGLTQVSFQVGDLREIDQLGSELGTFDQILCFEVIEHIYRDADVIRGLAQLLRPGGRLLITAPSADHHPLVGERLSPTEDGGHVRWGYSPDRLAELVVAAGLRIVEQGTVSGYVSQKLANLMRTGERIHWLLGWALVLPLRPLQVLDRPITRLRRWPYLSVTLVAELSSA